MSFGFAIGSTLAAEFIGQAWTNRIDKRKAAQRVKEKVLAKSKKSAKKTEM